ncbi:hypothetical protein EJV47_07220 [Hymenobacter gummosus]|uniref:ABC transporter permease n=1 Tax=Hymenobacter gummosus TaxID=1776032 RepID=A0A3S0QJH0_9BACT|nr:hypothetical protein [Hymenobacter gummosus]RTQ51583.1 hypothetical protein EJV47_07220 [Hymenobacter gummosus]
MNYYMLLVLPKRITRKQLVIGLVLSFVLLIGFAALMRAYISPSADAEGSILSSIANSIQLIIMLSIMNQFSILMVDMVRGFHEENNQENLHRFPVSLLVQHHERIKRVFTWFWTIAPVIVLTGIWFRGK